MRNLVLGFATFMVSAVPLWGFASACAQTPRTQQRAAPGQPPDTVAKNAVVEITMFDGAGKSVGKAGGFFVTESGNVVTCRHSVLSAHAAKVVAADKREHVVSGVVAEDKSADLIELALEGQPIVCTPLRLAPKVPDDDTPIFIVRPHSPLYADTTQGLVYASHHIPAFGTLFMTKTNLPPPSCGLPAVTPEGDVAGMLESGRTWESSTTSRFQPTGSRHSRHTSS